MPKLEQNPRHPCPTCQRADGYFWRPIDARGTDGPWRCSVCDFLPLGEESQVTAGVTGAEAVTDAVSGADWVADRREEPDLFDMDEG